MELQVYGPEADASGRPLLLSGDRGEVVAPAGTHVVVSYQLTATDEQGESWTALGRPPVGEATSNEGLTVAVPADGQCALDVGPPFTASVQITPDGSDEVFFDLAMTGREGGTWTVQKASAESAPPRFEVRDSDGKVVWQGDFAYG